MGLRYADLDGVTRTHMLAEIDLDVSSGTLFHSPRLSPTGRHLYASLLREAAESRDDDWLASELQWRGCIASSRPRRKPRGGISIARVPDNAHETLAEGEFNRFYARGLCARVVQTGGSEVEVYRGKQVQNPRPESEAMVGRRLPAQALLDDLRRSQGIEPALGLPPGPNSGLTVRRVNG